MVDPDATALATLHVFDDALNWAGLLAAGGDLRAAFVAELGGPLLMREVVLIASVDYEAAIASCKWTPTGGAERLLNAAEKARCRSLRRVCRLRCGLSAEEGAPGVVPGPVGGAAPPTSTAHSFATDCSPFLCLVASTSYQLGYIRHISLHPFCTRVRMFR